MNKLRKIYNKAPLNVIVILTLWLIDFFINANFDSMHYKVNISAYCYILSCNPDFVNRRCIFVR